MTTDDDRSFSLSMREPVRLYIYGVAAPGLAVALAYGLISAEMLPLWLALAGAALAVPATEAARRKVSSPATVAEMRSEPRGSTYMPPSQRLPGVDD